MLYWAMIFFIITIFAALFGFTTIAVGSASIAKIFFCSFPCSIRIFSDFGWSASSRSSQLNA
jgi:uncharacterized membrane protein YtjA (UPF0391 family)